MMFYTGFFFSFQALTASCRVCLTLLTEILPFVSFPTTADTLSTLQVDNLGPVVHSYKNICVGYIESVETTTLLSTVARQEVLIIQRSDFTEAFSCLSTII